MSLSCNRHRTPAASGFSTISQPSTSILLAMSESGHQPTIALQLRFSHKANLGRILEAHPLVDNTSCRRDKWRPGLRIRPRPKRGDIYSPRVPALSEMVYLLQKAANVIPAGNLCINLDCGLKIPGWPETEDSTGQYSGSSPARAAGNERSIRREIHIGVICTSKVPACRASAG